MEGERDTKSGLVDNKRACGTVDLHDKPKLNTDGPFGQGDN